MGTRYDRAQHRQQQQQQQQQQTRLALVFERRFEMALRAANLAEADILVASDAGLEESFGKDAVGAALGRAMLDVSGQVPQVMLAGSSAFQLAVLNATSDRDD